MDSLCPYTCCSRPSASASQTSRLPSQFSGQGWRGGPRAEKCGAENLRTSEGPSEGRVWGALEASDLRPWEFSFLIPAWDLRPLLGPYPTPRAYVSDPSSLAQSWLFASCVRNWGSAQR